MGCFKKLYDKNYVEPEPETEPVPEEFQGVYNVRLTREVIINPVAVNTQPIRFYTQPQIKVSERRLGTMERTDPAAPIVTDVFNVEGVPADGFASDSVNWFIIFLTSFSETGTGLPSGPKNPLTFWMSLILW